MHTSMHGCFSNMHLSLQLTELPLEELIRRKAGLEAEMDIELRELQVRYQTKRQPILDAIENKKAKAAAHF